MALSLTVDEENKRGELRLGMLSGRGCDGGLGNECVGLGDCLSGSTLVVLSVSETDVPDVMSVGGLTSPMVRVSVLTATSCVDVDACATGGRVRGVFLIIL